MITLYGGGEGFGLPEVSPYVTKTEVQLKMAELPYRKLTASPQESPKGQVPFVDVGGERIADSHFIRAYLEQTYGVDFDRGLNARERAEAWAIERMVENHLSWTLVNERWLDAVNFARGPAHFFDDAPPAVRATLRADVLERVRSTVHAVGIGRHSAAEVLALGARSLEALSALLCDKPYLFGDRATGTDAIVFAMLAGILTPWFDGPLRRQAEGFPDLVRYVERMMAEFYPGFAWRVTEPCREAAAA